MPVKAAVIALSLSLTVAQLAPFAVVAYKVVQHSSKSAITVEEPDANNSSIIDDANTDNTSEVDTGVSDDSVIDENSSSTDTVGNEPDESMYGTNTEIDIPNYGKIGFRAGAFALDTTTSSDTTQVLKYNTNSTLYISSATNIPSGQDVTAYLAQNILSIRGSVTETANIDIGDKQWVVVNTNAIEGECQVKLYYLLDQSQTHLVYIKANVIPEELTEDFENYMYYMMKSVNVTFGASTVFQTPNSGIYEGQGDPNADTSSNGNNGSGKPPKLDTVDKNSETNLVYQNKEGFVKTDRLNTEWSSMQMLVAGEKVALPSVLYEFIEKGFELDTDLNWELEDDLYGQNELTDLRLVKDNATISVDVVNTTNTPVPLKNARVVRISLKISDIREVADIPDDFIVLPSGVTPQVYKDDLISVYGRPAKEELIDNEKGNIMLKRLTWVSLNGNRLILDVGAVANIYRIEWVLANAY